jgi:hypothetical protein
MGTGLPDEQTCSITVANIAYWLDQALDLSLTQYWILKDLFCHSGEVRSTTDLMRAANITVQPNTIVVMTYRT